MTSRKRFYLDLLERSIWTFVEVFAMTLTVDSASSDLHVSLSTKLVMAATAGGYAVLKALGASRIGSRNSASTLSAVTEPSDPVPVDPSI